MIKRLKKILAKWLTPEAAGSWHMPPATYWMTRVVRACEPLFLKLGDLETRVYRRRLPEVDRPIYITGIARAGTTITLEMLHQHPDACTHRYYDLPNPFTPHWWDRIVHAVPLERSAPVERVHKDRLRVTMESPEMVEERLWQTFFPGLHNEGRSNSLGPEVRNDRFEAFYRAHIAKLLMNRRRSRYIVKNNNNVTRMDYLFKLFPDARFLLIVRDPVAHIGSMVKQQRIFRSIGAEDPKMIDTLAIVGHWEFGPRLAFLNVGAEGTIARIRSLWAEGREVEAWAVYWASIYGFVADRLDASPALADATLVVRYEALCGDSGPTIDAMLHHVGFAGEPFAEIRARYVDELSPPSYYEPDFTDEQLEFIRKETDSVLARFG